MRFIALVVVCLASVAEAQWKAGAFAGEKMEDAFFVKCDEETNPDEVRDAGQLVVEIGIAPVKPAEFVVFRIAQFSGGASLLE